MELTSTSPPLPMVGGLASDGFINSFSRSLGTRSSSTRYMLLKILKYDLEIYYYITMLKSVKLVKAGIK